MPRTAISHRKPNYCIFDFGPLLRNGVFVQFFSASDKENLALTCRAFISRVYWREVARRDWSSLDSLPFRWRLSTHLLRSRSQSPESAAEAFWHTGREYHSPFISWLWCLWWKITKAAMYLSNWQIIRFKRGIPTNSRWKAPVAILSRRCLRENIIIINDC